MYLQSQVSNSKVNIQIQAIAACSGLFPVLYYHQVVAPFLVFISLFLSQTCFVVYPGEEAGIVEQIVPFGAKHAYYRRQIHPVYRLAHLFGHIFQFADVESVFS